MTLVVAAASAAQRAKREIPAGTAALAAAAGHGDKAAVGQQGTEVTAAVQAAAPDSQRQGLAEAAGAGGRGNDTGGGGGSSAGGGGGGLGSGGAIFLRKGATVTITDGGISGNTLTAGAGGAKNSGFGGGTGATDGGPGSAIGQAIFLAGSATYQVSANNTVTIADTFGGGANALITGGFTKTGAGTLALSGSNSYTGGTIVSDGTLLANNSSGSATGTGTVTVNSGGKLGGTGTISGAVTVNSGGTLAPGVSPGILTSGNVSFASGSTFSVEITGATEGSQYDQLNVTGTVALNNATISVSGAYVPAVGESFVIINNDGADAVTGTFNSLPEGSIVTMNGVTRKLTYIGGTGNDVVLLATPEIAVQQPADTELVNGAGSIDFGTVIVGSNSLVKTFTITNSGTANLTSLVITNTGTNPGDFIVSALDSTTVNPSSTATFTVTFTPTAVVNRSATLQITSNVTGTNNPFIVNLSGQGYYTQAQFDANRVAGISDVTSSPNTYDLYTTSQVQALNVGTPLIQRNPTTGLFTLTIGVQKSTNLVDFIHLPMTAPQTTINAQGKLEFQFSSPDNAAFFRLESK
jgi:autotransporter-associated beta strand protein